MSALDGMTWDRWRAMPERERAAMRDRSGLSPQLIGLEGARVEVRTTYGEVRRFWAGLSTGWRQIHLEVKTKRSTGGAPAETTYASVRVVRRGRNGSNA